MTTPEERIKAAAEAMTKFKLDNEEARIGLDEFARVGLAAAYPEDFPPKPKPKWPSDESLAVVSRHFKRKLDEYDVEAVRNILRADPIIEAAAEWKAARFGRVAEPAAALRRAVDEAGL